MVGNLVKKTGFTRQKTCNRGELINVARQHQLNFNKFMSRPQNLATGAEIEETKKVEIFSEMTLQSDQEELLLRAIAEEKEELVRYLVENCPPRHLQLTKVRNRPKNEVKDGERKDFTTLTRIFEKFPVIAGLIIDNPSKFDVPLKNIMSSSVTGNNSELLEKTLDRYGITDETEVNSLINLAVANQSDQSLKVLLEKYQVFYDAESNMTLEIAFSLDKIAVAKVILENFPSLNIANYAVDSWRTKDDVIKIRQEDILKVIEGYKSLQKSESEKETENPQSELLKEANRIISQVNLKLINNSQLSSEYTKDLECPISCDKMTDPVTVKFNDLGKPEYSQFYERAKIQEWMKVNPSDPTSRRPLSNEIISVSAAINEDNILSTLSALVKEGYEVKAHRIIGILAKEKVTGDLSENGKEELKKVRKKIVESCRSKVEAIMNVENTESMNVENNDARQVAPNPRTSQLQGNSLKKARTLSSQVERICE